MGVGIGNLVNSEDPASQGNGKGDGISNAVNSEVPESQRKGGRGGRYAKALVITFLVRTCGRALAPYAIFHLCITDSLGKTAGELRGAPHAFVMVGYPFPFPMRAIRYGSDIFSRTSKRTTFSKIYRASRVSSESC